MCKTYQVCSTLVLRMSFGSLPTIFKREKMHQTFSKVFTFHSLLTVLKHSRNWLLSQGTPCGISSVSLLLRE